MVKWQAFRSEHCFTKTREWNWARQWPTSSKAPISCCVWFALAWNMSIACLNSGPYTVYILTKLVLPEWSLVDSRLVLARSHRTLRPQTHRVAPQDISSWQWCRWFCPQGLAGYGRKKSSHRENMAPTLPVQLKIFLRNQTGRDWTTWKAEQTPSHTGKATSGSLAILKIQAIQAHTSKTKTKTKPQTKSILLYT